MTTYAGRPGYGLYETKVRDKRTGRVTVERRWMRDRVAFNLNADPVPPTTWDSTGWLPDGRHRKTGTPLNPGGVPVEYDQALRGGDASLMTDGGVTKVHRAHVPAEYARATALALPERRRGEAPDIATRLYGSRVGAEHLPLLVDHSPQEVEVAASGIAPEYAAEVMEAERIPDGTTVMEVPVIRNGVISMENRRVAYTDRDAAQKPLSDTLRDRRWGRDDRPVTAADLAQPDDPREVRLPYGWQETRKVIKRMGGKWSAMSKTWRLPDAEKATEIRRFLEDRATREGII